MDQQVELLGGEGDQLAVEAGLVGDEVDLELAGPQDRRLGRAASAPLARRSTAFTRAVSSRGENGLAT